MKRIILFGLFILFFSCSTRQATKIDKVKVNFKPEINLLVDSNNLIFNYTLILNSDFKEEKQRLNLIKFLRVVLLDENNHIIDSSSIYSLIKAGIGIDGYNLIYFGKVVINNFKRKDFENINCKVLLVGANWDLTVTQKLNTLLYSESEPALVVYPLIENIDEKSIDLGVFAIRKRIVEEYIPNSETFRIEVLNSKNKPVYNSQEGKAFMQVIMPVEPLELGDFYIYRYSWDYRNSNGNRLPTGEYVIKMMIPANPKPYITEIKIPVETK